MNAAHTETLIAAAINESKPGLHDAAKIAAAINAGFADGDTISLGINPGGHLVAHIHGTDVAMVNDGKETARIALASMSQAQRDRMLIFKGIKAGKFGYVNATVSGAF